MADRSYDPGHHPDMAPPILEVGVLGWLRTNLFSTWYNSLLSVGVLYLVYLVIPPVLNWAFIDADWVGDKAEDCSRVGACWVYVKVWFWTFIYGRYPADERWRINLAFLILFLAAIPLFMPRFKYKQWIGLFLLVGFPILSYFLFVGGMAGLVLVETPLWGGLFLTTVIGSVGIVVSLPIGVVLALGRRSHMPAIRALCVAFIELWRGVPLITVLFMSSVMFPLFLPEGMNLDKLVRALTAVALFSAAYMAEVVRGGLQAIPRGQYEAAQALGLSYWKMMWLIVLPQALKMVIPGIVNTFIGLFKDTTLVLIIGLMDFLGMVQASFTNPNWPGFADEGYVFVAVVFAIICFGMSRYSQALEKKLQTSY